jgi:hypothetical protein
MSTPGSPLLDQYNKDGIVTPGLQRAMELFKQKNIQQIAPLSNAPAPQQPASFLNPNPRPFGMGPSEPQESAASLWNPNPRPFGMAPSEPQPSTGPTPLAGPTPLSASPSPHQAELNRLTAPPIQNGPLAHTKADTGRSGIDQVHNPWLRNTFKVLDAIGSGFAPGLTSAIPGTQLHHQLLVRGARANVNQDEKQSTDQANREHLGAETSELGARGTEEQARADEITHPKAKEVANDVQAWLADPKNAGKPFGEFWKEKYQAEAEAKPKEPKEAEMPVGNPDQLNKTLESRYQVLNPGKPLPDQFKLPANATQKDYDRIDKALEATERATGTKAQQDQLNEMRRQTAAIAAGNRNEKQSTETRNAAYKAYEPALDSAERFNVMSKNYDDAVKNHDQQAMLSLLANHLGMTMGLQKGARLTKDIIHEAEQSRPWLQGLQAKFDKDGYLSGVNLTPPQMEQMLNLGRERFAEDIRKSSSAAKYLGATDEGPERTPNRSTVNHYVTLAHGDVNEAKRLAAQDGWTVK